MRDAVFVSYSHHDSALVAEFQQALSAQGTGVSLNIWSDQQIRPAERWREGISEALGSAAAAVLFLSRAFFESSFIREYELPAILAAAERSELRLFAVLVGECGSGVITETYQAVNDPAKPLASLGQSERDEVWKKLADSLSEVAATIDQETRIGAEIERVQRDLSSDARVMQVSEKIAKARVDPAFEGNESVRESALTFLEEQLCQAQTTWLIEESKRPELSPIRSKAIVRLLREIAAREEAALQRATQQTQQFADQTLDMLKRARQPE